MTVSVTFSGLGELHGIAQQVDQNLSQPGPVSPNPARQSGFNGKREFESLLCRPNAEQIDRLLDAFREVERLIVDFEPA